MTVHPTAFQGILLSDVTELLLQWNGGDEEARALLIHSIYAELNEIAARCLSRENHARDVQPQALVHAAYLKLVDLNRINWQNRAHFLAMAAKVMRDILVSEARKRNAAKRDGGAQVTLNGLFESTRGPATDALVLHEALERLAGSDPERARLVELRFFGGLTVEETAEVLGISAATVKRSWQVARGWLFRYIEGDGAD